MRAEKLFWIIIVSLIVIINIVICIIKGYDPLKYLKKHPIIAISLIIVIVIICALIMFITLINK